MLKEFLLFIKSQFATDSQNVLHLKECKHGDIWSWILHLFKGSGVGCEWLDTNKKYVGGVSSFSVGVDVPTIKNLKD